MSHLRSAAQDPGVSRCATLDRDDEALVREIIARVSDKWSLWALNELVEDGPLRFARLLERLTGISQKSLTATLRQLERNGLVERAVTVRSPIRVDYAATPLGQELIGRFAPFWSWVAQDRARFASARERFDQDASQA